jgi:branched-chain amino acid transport system ATP-binding protein
MPHDDVSALNGPRDHDSKRTLLELSDVHVAYGKVEAVKGITLDVRDGEIVTLIGANGAGKTTILKTISGIRPPTSGTIQFQGSVINAAPPHKIVEMGVSQAPEGRQIFPGMSVAENLSMGAYARRDRKGVSEDYERVYSLFPVLSERRAQHGGTLSGGEQQMLAIGRALMARPKVLLLDEPSMGLAPMLVQQIFSIIKEINEQGTTILLVEQNAQQALSRANRGYVLESGHIVLSDSAANLLKNDQVRKSYLGET